MFDFVRNHTRVVLGFLLLLIVPSFVFFGVQGYSRFTEAGNETVAKVDGVAITRAEWDAAHARNVERVRRQSPDIDVQLLDSPQVKRETLDRHGARTRAAGGGQARCSSSPAPRAWPCCSTATRSSPGCAAPTAASTATCSPPRA